jgi:hypothetical protein
MISMRMPANMMLGVIGILCLSFLSCGDQRSTKKDVQIPPWPELDAPNDLLSMAEDLLAYQSSMGRMPNDLNILDRSGLSTAGPYAAKAYVYHPAGIGVLRDGWRVMAADDRIRNPDRLWCVVRPPVRVIGLPPLRVVNVPIDELSAAAASAGGG